MLIRLAELDRDAGAILALQHAAYAKEAELAGVGSLPPQHQTVEQLADEILWLAEDDGVIMGVMGLEEADEPLIAKLAVHPDHMSKGIGRALVRHAIALGAGRPVRTGTAAANAPALALYASLGFERGAERLVGDGIAFVDLRRA